jgi:hypothetical protein
MIQPILLRAEVYDKDLDASYAPRYRIFERERAETAKMLRKCSLLPKSLNLNNDVERKNGTGMSASIIKLMAVGKVHDWRILPLPKREGRQRLGNG